MSSSTARRRNPAPSSSVARAFSLEPETDNSSSSVEYVTGFGSDGRLIDASSSHSSSSSSSGSGSQQKSGPPLVIPLLDEVTLPPPRSEMIASTTTKSTTENTSTSTSTTSTENPSAAGSSPQSLEEMAAADLLREAANGVGGEAAAAVKVHELPLLMRNRVPEVEEAEDEDERYRRDVAHRPEAPSLDAYDRVPIAEFGAALLRGMGWSDGECVGRNQNGLAEPIMFVKRHHRLGLGATPKDVLPPAAGKKYVRPGESREAPVEMEVARGEDGRVRHYRGLDEKLVRKKKLEVGCTVYVVQGVHAGLDARVLSLHEGRSEGDRGAATVRFVSGESARVHRDHLSLHRSDLERLHSKKGDRGSSSGSGSGSGSNSKHSRDESGVRTSSQSSRDGSTSSSRSSSSRSSQSGTSSGTQSSRSSDPSDRRELEADKEGGRSSRKRKADRDEPDHSSRSSSSTSSSSSSSSRSSKQARVTSTSSSSSSSSSSASSAHSADLWMMPKIVVRIVSKSLEQGQLYRKRVVIVDVPTRSTCTVRTDSGRLVEEIKQRHIET
eukprot:CAMPEP_0174231950 /NCGR_PEP_ID=MMETSP0417-20130205/2348_1 /TAXON_ID=242541 /ORGANISM="Mayorella sp, Strain BSH-02190019" /LENGTH=552 /DNA_ID=CAMNT_0015309919 /DNA_START=147 /DNA_END=1802 /DNA_ORIENTATION=+